MQKENIISIGKLAKTANVSIRTLQYYDKIGLLTPSSISEGGRRFYNERDIAILHQIITLKSFGLTLDEIKNRIMPVNNSGDVLTILNHQSKIITEQISKSKKILESIEMLKKEITESESVDWSKYSNMMKLINDNNEYYWVINYLEKDILNRISEVHEKETEYDNSLWLKKVLEKAIELDIKGVPPESEEAQNLASQWWYFVQQYTDGDIELIKQLYNFYSTAEQWPDEFGQIQKKSKLFMEKAIEKFLVNNNITIPIEKEKS